jgi:hypothetical protein
MVCPIKALFILAPAFHGAQGIGRYFPGIRHMMLTINRLQAGGVHHFAKEFSRRAYLAEKSNAKHFVLQT